jgi:nicotinamidase-related amidase
VIQPYGHVKAPGGQLLRLQAGHSLHPMADSDSVAELTQYVLITQCLQNDFFFNLDCALCLPEAAAARLLLDANDEYGFQVVGHRRELSDRSRRSSPLAQFLDAVVGSRISGAETRHLHLINIRDWHVPGEHYDRERSQYGAHCEEGTWGAQYLEGFEDYLDPARTSAPHGRASRTEKWSDRLTVHHVYSDTLFDFQYANAQTPHIRQDAPLTAILDAIVSSGGTPRVAVIGVLTDIKIQLLLVGLRSRYNFRQLVVSDPLTASRSLERHLTALDYAQSVLWVEVMDSLAELARFLGARPSRDELTGRGATVEFARYSSYVDDKQGILSYEDARLRDYRRQTTERLRRTHRTVTAATRFLVGWGMTFMTIALVMSVLAVLFPARVTWQVPAIAGGVGFIPLVAVLFFRPLRILQNSTNSDTIFRMVLESRSLKVALARYHLTATESLRERDNAHDQLAFLDQELNLLQRIDQDDFNAIRQLGVAPPTRNARPSSP